MFKRQMHKKVVKFDFDVTKLRFSRCFNMKIQKAINKYIKKT